MKPKTFGLTDRLRTALSEPDADDPTKTVGQRLIELCLEYARKGDFRFFKEIMERVEGPVPTRTELTGADGGPVEYVVPVPRLLDGGE